MSLRDFVFVAVPLFGTPPMLVAAWWGWWRGGPGSLPLWRSTLVIEALAAASLNAVLYYGWLTYFFRMGDVPQTWHLRDILAGSLTDYLALGTLVGAVVARGITRILLLVVAVTGWLLWIRHGIL